MIKKGDKVICIDDVVDVDDYSTPFEKGNIYEVSAIVSHDWFDNTRSVLMFDNSYLFDYDFPDSEIYFFKYFILLSEFREQQIKTILDD